MTPILLLWIRLASVSQPPWEELSLSISQEIGISSDTVTLCRVRVVNHGARAWPGRQSPGNALCLFDGFTIKHRRQYLIELFGLIINHTVKCYRKGQGLSRVR